MPSDEAASPITSGVTQKANACLCAPRMAGWAIPVGGPSGGGALSRRADAQSALSGMWLRTGFSHVKLMYRTVLCAFALFKSGSMCVCVNSRSCHFGSGLPVWLPADLIL